MVTTTTTKMDNNSVNASKYKFNDKGEKVYKILTTDKFRASGNFGNNGLIMVSSQMVEIQAGTEVIIVKTGINNSHPDMCKAFVPSMDIYLEAVSMICDLDDRF